MTKIIKTCSLLLLINFLVLIGECRAFSLQKVLSQQPEVAHFIDLMVSKHHFDKNQLIKLLNKAQITQPVISNIKAPFEMQPWLTYKNYFLTPERINLGAEFWHQHKQDLIRAEKQFGVPQEIIIAILGIETKYGTHQGEHRVIDALATLSFSHLARSDYFKMELEQFLLLCRELQLDPLSMYGSYAGAIGQSQFMPSSYRIYAIDFNGHGSKDLRYNTADAIGSIANYLSKHGWFTGGIVAVPAAVTGDNYKQFIEKSSKPLFKISDLIKNGIKPQAPINQSTLASLINLESDKTTEFWLGFNNFYVITRYNSNKLYAMAVYNLSHEIKQKYLQQFASKG